jgi:hypothetical protein
MYWLQDKVEYTVDTVDNIANIDGSTVDIETNQVSLS